MLDRELVITSSQELCLYVVFENREAVEVRVEHKTPSKQSGSIYKGKVKRVVPAMNAAFVDIGDDKEAFLPLKDTNSCEGIKQNEPIIVQVRRTAISSKGAKLSCKITLPGKYLVLMPNSSQVSISSKIEKEEKEKLKEYITNIIKPLNTENYGFIIRTSATEVSDIALLEDFVNLKEQWKEIQNRFKTRKPPSLLYGENSKVF
ncbi:MAG: S1 RNA-binding domain-containing protein, partial [Aquificae bacterium]|nr:S1 RNA-binding domain-containing protein [Aquificota bacterium]